MGGHPVHITVIASGEPALKIRFMLLKVDVAYTNLRESQFPGPAANLAQEFCARKLIHTIFHQAAALWRCGTYNRIMLFNLIPMIVPEAKPQ
jgi:hypothetical protein